jgi:hypothetical protein
VFVVSILIDERTMLRRSGFEGPLVLVAAAIVGSIVVNGRRVEALGVGTDVVKSVIFWLSFVIVFYVLVTALRTTRDVMRPLHLLAVGGAVLGGLAIVESRTGYNPFDHVSRVLPFFDLSETPSATSRSGLHRAYGSAQHPIAFGAAMAMLAPLSFSLAFRTRRTLWWVAFFLTVAGCLASVSRTSALMLGVSGATILLLRPETRRMLPYAIPLALVAIHFALPGTVAAFQHLFFPKGGIIANQAAAGVGQARVTTLRVEAKRVSSRPFLGGGFGARITVGDRQNAYILDDGWLGVLIDTGVVGAAGWLWLFGRFIRRTAREAKDDVGERGWMLAVFCASVASYAVSMFFYDAFSFIQVTIFAFVVMGMGAAVLLAPREQRASPEGTEGASPW